MLSFLFYSFIPILCGQMTFISVVLRFIAIYTLKRAITHIALKKFLPTGRETS